MKLLPRLVEANMFIAFGERDEYTGQHQLGRREIRVELWQNTGLAIHTYNDEISIGKWRVTHMESGRSILRHMKSREQAIQYLLRLRQIAVDWRISEEKFESLENRSEVKKQVDALQREISGEIR